MKKIIPLIVFTLLASHIYAQTPEGMSYQAIVRNENNTLVIESAVGMQISILQGSASGNAVYVERHFPTTNSNGLVSLQIGNGVLVSGNFAAIDWSNGPYFIKTETDLAGGANYKISGTSQLLSVPYALHAKTAENTNEVDPVFESSVASAITDLDTLRWSNKQDKLTPGEGIIISDNQISIKTYAIGDTAFGGIIFYVEPCKTKGLVASFSDRDVIDDETFVWKFNNNINYYTMAFSNGLYAGQRNTNLIIVAQNSKNEYYAANAVSLAALYNGEGYGDWYLPSRYELNLLYLQRSLIGGFDLNGVYWSSSESNETLASAQSFSSGNQFDAPKTNRYKVRAIRAF